MARFDGKVALITGSTQGLGEAIAHRLAHDGAAGIMVSGRNEMRGAAVAASVTASGSDAEFCKADLGDMADVERLVATTDDYFGRIDVLVNAAGLSDRGSIVDTTSELWDRLLNVNLRAPFFLIQGVVEVMRREGTKGTIVNVGSLAAYGSVPMLAPYAISKGGLGPLTRNVAYALARDHIRVNTLNIGWMDTPGEDVIQRKYHDADPDWLERAEAQMPFGRLLKPEEVAKAVAFLASEDSGMMTGAIVDFDQSVIGAGKHPIIDPDQVPA